MAEALMTRQAVEKLRAETCGGMEALTAIGIPHPSEAIEMRLLMDTCLYYMDKHKFCADALRTYERTDGLVQQDQETLVALCGRALKVIHDTTLGAPLDAREINDVTEALEKAVKK